MQHSWCDALMVFTDAKTVIIDEKEVKSIVLQDGGVLYKKKNINREPIILKFTGTDFSIDSSNQFTGENIVIDWGDGTTTNYTARYDFNHTYSEDAEHTITISNVTEIGTAVFSSTDITEIFIPSSVVSLGHGTFNNCGLLEMVILSEGLTTIGASCLTTCDSLTKITIPKSVTTINSAFCGGTPIENINLLWDTSESIIEYDTNIFGNINTDYTFNIPEGTTQLYVDKGYPLAKLVEGATSITLTSDKDIVGVGETAIITGTLNYPSQDKVVIFNTKTPESVTMTPGDNYYSIGENGFDITDFSNAFFLTSNIDNGYYLYVNYYGASNGEKALSVIVRAEDGGSFPPLVNKLRYPIKLHIDENNIITYRYKDYEKQEVICLVKNLSNYRYLDEYTKEEGFTQWQLSGENSLTVTKNTGLSVLTDSNGQATMEYEGVGAGDVTITGTYLDKDVSDSIVINDTSVLYLTSNKESIKRDETAILTALLLPEKANETIYINKIINDENLVLELTSTRNRTDYIIKAKVIDEEDNGLENIRIKLYKEE